MRNKFMINKGFTLVELLVVVVILAILAGIVVPQFASSTDDAESAAVDYTLSTIRVAIDLYYQQHGAYPGANIASGGTCTGGTAGAGAVGTQVAFLDQLTYYTDSNGLACSTKQGAYEYGPYLKKRPLTAEPFLNISTIAMATSGDLLMIADAPAPGPGGYKFDSVSGKFIVNVTTEQAR